MTPIPKSSLPTVPTAPHTADHALFPREALAPFMLVTGLFFLWGIPNNLNDVLIRQFMKSFELSRFKAGLVQSAFYFGYFACSLPAAMIMRRVGYQRGLVTGLIIYGLGALLFWPAALAGQYLFFLIALFVIATGLAFLETGANPLVAEFGDPSSSERRLNFSQAFNPLGAITGVLIGTVFIFSGIELTSAQIRDLKAQGTYQAYLHSEILRVIAPYLVVGVVALLWAIVLAKTKFPAIAEARPSTEPHDTAHPRQLLHMPHFLLALPAEFLYVGAQVGTWSYFIQYIQDYTHQSEKAAGYLLTGTLVAFGIGRFLSAYLMKFIAPNLLMGAFAMINVFLVAVGVLLPGWTGVWAIFLTSFCMSLMFPTIFALGLKALGANTKIGGSFLVMSIIGGAVITPIMGLVSEATKSMAMAMLVPLCCYLYIAYYGLAGSRVRPPRHA